MAGGRSGGEGDGERGKVPAWAGGGKRRCGMGLGGAGGEGGGGGEQGVEGGVGGGEGGEGGGS